MIWPLRKGCQTRTGSVARPFRRSRARGRPARSRGRLRDTPWGYARIALRPLAGAVYCSRALGAGTPRETSPRGTRQRNREGCPWYVARNSALLSRGTALPIAATSSTRYPIDHMDAKQVWRAALGELQVSLSPANFETWLRDTYLVDVDDARFRIAVPNGFAKDWLDTRYRSLISQTLARVVGYSVQVEFVVTPRRRGAGPGHRPSPRSPCASSPPGSAPPRARPPARPTSTRATRSRTSSSARPTAWPTRRRCRSPSGPATRTTRCSCTAASASARPT